MAQKLRNKLAVAVVDADDDVADVLAVGSLGALAVAIVDNSGNQVTISSGGVSMVDDAAFTPATSSFTPSGGIVTSDSVDSGDGGAFAMTTARVQLIGGDVAHDGIDAGYPLKIGGYASDSAPTAVAAADRTNLWLTRLGAAVIAQDTAGNAGSDTRTITGGVFTRIATSAGTLVPTEVANMMYDGSTNWVRQRGDAANGLDVDVTRLPSATIAGTTAATGSGNATGALRVELANNGTGLVGLNAGTNAIGKLAANSGVDIGDVDVTSISAGSNLIGDVGIQPRTGNGLSTFMASGSDGSSILVATAQVIKASAGKLYGYYAYNPEAAVTFVHFYNTAAASVTVGTTNPLFTLAIPAGAAANLMSEIGITFSNAGWSCAATTTAGGNTAPSTGVSLVAWYA